MPKYKPIPLEHGYFYHIYNRGNGGENIFREQRNYGYFLTLYAKHIEPIAETHAYCLLKNHFHLLVRIREKETCQVSENLTGLKKYLDPSQQFSNLFNAYTKSVNVTYGRTGNLFQRPFGRILITHDEYFAYLIHYIHSNPQKHGFIDDFREYPYSSYDAMLSDKSTKLARDAVLAWFGGKTAFVKAHQSVVDEIKIAKLIEEDQDLTGF
jgi:putative transposase